MRGSETRVGSSSARSAAARPSTWGTAMLEETAEAWWIERDGERQFLRYDRGGEMVAVDVTEATFGGSLKR